MVMMDSTNDLLEPNIERLLSAFHLEEPERVPNFDPQIDHRNLEYLLGKPMPKASSNWSAPIEDRIELCRRIGNDAMVFPMGWGPGRINLGLAGNYDLSTQAISLEETLVKDWKDLHILESARENTPSIIERHKKFLEDILEKIKGTGIGIAPLILCDVVCVGYGVLGLGNFSKKLYTDIDFVKRIIDIYTEETVKVATALAEFDLSFIFVNSDPCDSHGTIIPPRLMDELWMPRIEAMIKPFKRRGIPMIMHACGKLTQLIPYLIELGIKAVHPIQPGCNDIYALKKKYGDEICLIGNIDIAGPLAFGTPQEVVKEVKEHIDRLAEGGGYVCATSHSVTDKVIPENYLAMLKTAHKYGIYHR